MKQRLGKILQVTVSIILLAVAFYFLGQLVGIALDKNAKIDCLKWQSQAKVYPAFYLTQNQSDQCDSVDVVVDAPVK